MRSNDPGVPESPGLRAAPFAPGPSIKPAPGGLLRLSDMLLRLPCAERLRSAPSSGFQDTAFIAKTKD